ncbi:hypothetical protein KQI65_04350 [bacterium]|nr:hypothetical protein [bacterium]
MRKAFLILALTSLPFLSACDEDDPVTPQEEHVEAVGIVLYQAGNPVAQVLRGESTDTLFATADNTSDMFEARFFDEHDDIFEADAEHHMLDWEIADTTVASVVQDSGSEGSFSFRLRGKTQGATSIEFFILHEGHADFRSGSLPLVVQ